MVDRQWLRAAATRGFYNRIAVMRADSCCCYHCCALLKPDAIAAWADNGQTALCPSCGVDAVIPETVPMADLRLMRAYWFEGEEL